MYLNVSRSWIHQAALFVSLERMVLPIWLLVAAERQHPSGALPKEFEAGVAFATGGQYTNLPGGLPIVLDGIHIGGIGVSGGSGDDDLDVARAGLAAIGAA